MYIHTHVAYVVEQSIFRCQWMKNWLNKVWDTDKVVTNLLMLKGHTCHRFATWIWANESHPHRFARFRTAVYKAPQTAKDGNKTLPHCSAGVTTLLHIEIASHWSTQGMWMSRCALLLQIHPKAVFDLQVGSTLWRYNVKTINIPCWITFWYILKGSIT